MAGQFTAASTQYLSNASPPIADYPFSVAAWVNLAAVGTGTRCIFSLSDTATTTNLLKVGMNASEQINASAAGGGTTLNFALTTVITPGSWIFVLARFISSTNRRLSALYPSGLIEHAVNTTSRVPTGLDRVTIGALETSGGVTEPWDGLIGEVWYTATDIQADGAQLQDDMLRQLAFGGPFSVPHIAKDVREYRSLRCALASDQDNAEEVYAQSRQTWSNVNGVTLGQHPPLPYWYEKPKAAAGLVMI